VTENDDDYRIIKLCLRGKKDAFAQLVDRYDRKVYNLAFRLTSNPEKAKDIAQEAFIKVYRSLDKFDPKYKFSSWLLKTVSNLCIDYHRSKQATTASLEVILSSGAEASILQDDASASPTEDAIEAKLSEVAVRDIIREGIELLPIDYKSVVVMRHVQNFSYKEISDVLNLPMGTIKARIFRARKMLKMFLESKLAAVR
jgi:RNA polymerase sigma-70 factor (ECF subfamily)